ncbi:hypothetical protein OG965_16645 [Streptomyces sp. NBC_00224]|uniref:Helix-turn-helix domain-containing protein n=2 Tax=Streptomyces TaxID=1883 RepID=A0AAU2HDF8_9ACTN
MSRAELLELPVVIDLVTAARALGIGRTRAFELARRGEFPVPVLRVGATWRVPTAPLLATLGCSQYAIAVQDEREGRQ